MITIYCDKIEKEEGISITKRKTSYPQIDGNKEKNRNSYRVGVIDRILKERDQTRRNTLKPPQDTNYYNNKNSEENCNSSSNNRVKVVHQVESIANHRHVIKIIIENCLVYGFRDYSILNMVCKKWYMIMKNDQLWENVCHLKWPFIKQQQLKFKQSLFIPVPQPIPPRHLDERKIKSNIKFQSKFNIKSWKSFYDLWDGFCNWSNAFPYELIEGSYQHDHIILTEQQKSARYVYGKGKKRVRILSLYQPIFPIGTFLTYTDFESYVNGGVHSRFLLETLQFDWDTHLASNEVLYGKLVSLNNSTLTLVPFSIQYNTKYFQPNCLLNYGHQYEYQISIQNIDQSEWLPLVPMTPTEQLKISHFAKWIGWMDTLEQFNDLILEIVRLFEVEFKRHLGSRGYHFQKSL